MILLDLGFLFSIQATCALVVPRLNYTMYLVRPPENISYVSTLPDDVKALKGVGESMVEWVTP